MSSTAQPSASATPSNCAYGFCGNACLETSISVCCTGTGSGNSSGTVQCGNGWFCSQTSGQCCPAANQEYCSGADQCIDATAGQTCCGSTWCPQNQTCASSGDRCCPNSQTVCATDWWLVPVSTSVTIISMTTTPSTHPTTVNSQTASSASQTSTTTSLPSSNKSLSTGAEAGIAAGAALVVAAIVGLVILLLKKRRSRTTNGGPLYAPAGTSEHETATAYDFGAPEQNIPLVGYMRGDIPLVTTTPPIDSDQFIPPEYEDQDEETYTSFRAPIGSMIPRE